MSILTDFKEFGLKKVKENIDLFPYLTLRTRTKAEYFFEARSAKDLILAKKASIEFKIPLFVLGGGTNLAVISPNITGLVVKNNYLLLEKIPSNNKDTSLVLVSSGYPVARLVNETIEAGLEGFEYQLGLPGTVGGAIYMNSKWTNPPSYFGSALLHANLIDNGGNVKKVSKDYFEFAYDSSVLQKTNEILLEAVFELKKTPVEVLKKRSQSALSYRRATQPIGTGTSGCFFRNIGENDKSRLSLETTSAGYLIDKTGLKGKKVGKFYVSPIHANFIINEGNGDPTDLKKLLTIIKEAVSKKYNVDLKEEVIIL